MATGYIPTEEDRQKFRLLLEESRTRVQSTQNRPHVPADIPQAPEVYIARTPSPHGIPALTSRLDGTTLISSAECDIWRVVRAPDGLDELHEVVGVDRRVYNPWSYAIGGGLIIVVARDKPGSWLAIQSCCDGSDDDDDDDDQLTGTGTGTGTGTAGCDAVTITETECVGGVLRSRTVWLDFIAGCLVKTAGSWVVVGCCECEDDVTGTGTDGVTGTATSGDDCECDVFPERYTASLAGFTTCIGLNDQWVFTRVAGTCTYTGSNAFASAVLTLVAHTPGACFGNQFTLVLTHGASSATYRGTTTDCDCCVTVPLGFQFGSCNPHPAIIYLVPGEPCEGNTGTATDTSPTGTGTPPGETGTSTGQGVGADCDCDIPPRLVVTFAGSGCLNGLSLVMTSDGFSMNGNTGTPCGFTDRVYASLGCKVPTPGAALLFAVSCGGTFATTWEISCPSGVFTFSVNGDIINCGSGVGENYTVTVTE